MRHTTVELSDGKPCKVRQLAIFELDNVAPDLADPGPFYYDIRLAGGKVVEAPYDLSTFDTPLSEPAHDRKAAEPGSAEADEWREWDLYRGAIAHQQKRIMVAEKRLKEIARYIVNNCLKAEDRHRIVTLEDWSLIHNAAIVHEVTYDDLTAALNTTFDAKWGDRPILDALAELPGSAGSYIAIRQWENELMVRLNLSEAEYGMLSVQERARKIAAMKMPEWMETLASHEAARKMKNKGR